MKRWIETVDADTGEILEGVAMFVPMKRRNGFTDGWVAMAQDALSALARAGLGARDYQVLLELLGRLDFENLIMVSQVDLARSLGLLPANVNRSIKRLVQLQVLLEGPRIGVSRTYRLNPGFGWKGSAKGHREALKRRLEVIQGGRADQEQDPTS